MSNLGKSYFVKLPTKCFAYFGNGTISLLYSEQVVNTIYTILDSLDSYGNILNLKETSCSNYINCIYVELAL